MSQIRVNTQRLELIAVWDELARAAIANRSKLAQMIAAQVPNDWPPAIMSDVMEYFAQRLEDDPEIIGWWAWYVVLNQENSARVLIGSAGFNGYPDEDGTVTMGYSVVDTYHKHGYATEAVRGLIEWAFKHPNVMCVTAETFDSHIPSLRVMEKNNMIFLDVGSEPGLVKYGITRARYEAMQ